MGRFSKLGRLEVKLLALLVLLTALPVSIALWQSSLLFDRSLGAGLNPRIGHALDDSVTVFGDFMRAERGRQQALAQGIATSTMLRSKSFEGPKAIESLLRTSLKAPRVLSIRLVPQPGGKPIDLIADLGPDADWLPRTESIPLVDVQGFTTLHYTYGLERGFVDRFRRLESDVIQPFATLVADRHRVAGIYAWSLAGMLVAALSVAALIALFIGRRLTRRLKKLGEAMKSVAAGEWDTFVPPEGHDEVTDLTTGFNQMARQLHESRERVQYLTQISAWQGIARRLAHEIKNPLTPIQLSVQQAQQSYTGDDARHQQVLDTVREVVEEEVATLKRLVENFSRFARLPTANLEVSDLTTLAQDVANAHPEIADIAAKIPEEPVYAAIDRGLLRQALTNLVKNGAEAARDAQRSPVVRIGVCRSVNGHPQMIIDDNGHGVPKSEREHIFEPYVTGKSDGTGLGLAIVKKLVLEHEGSIVISDAPNGGARFTITLTAPHSETELN